VDKTPTVYDVAARAGVSIATVSRVFRRPDSVRPETRAVVMDAVRVLGYVPSGSARGLADRRTGVLGLLLPGHDEPRQPPAKLLPDDGSITLMVDPADADLHATHDLYYDEVLLGAEREAWAAGYALMVGAGGEHSDSAVDISGRVDGLIAVGIAAQGDVLAHSARRIPVVLVSGRAPSTAFDRISAANEEGMHALVRHLVDAHDTKRILYIAGPTDSSDADDRRAGFDTAIAQSRGAVTAWVVVGDFTRGTGRRIAADVIDAGKLPDAIVCANDQTALGVMDALIKRGVTVPTQVIVTGFDGIDSASASRPRLTTVRQPMFGLGAEAVRSLVQRLEGERTEVTSVRLAVDVLLRESCGCLTEN
jgi:LacI family transcriptional regulator